MFIIYLIFRKPSRSGKPEERLTPAEEEELIAEWTPEPLVPTTSTSTSTSASGFQKVLTAEEAKEAQEEAFLRPGTENDRPYVVRGTGPWIELSHGIGKTFNLSSANYLGLSQREEIKDACRKTIEEYGVGSCGPRGFYGTIDVHLEAEQVIADLLETPEAIIYSDGIATIASVIPAFSGRGDIIVWYVSSVFVF